MIVDEQGIPVKPEVEGTLVVKRPFPGLTPSLWHDGAGYIKNYWNKITPGVYTTGDVAIMG